MFKTASERSSAILPRQPLRGRCASIMLALSLALNAVPQVLALGDDPLGGPAAQAWLEKRAAQTGSEIQARRELWKAWNLKGEDFWAIEDNEAPATRNGKADGRFAEAITNLEEGLFDSGQYWDTVRVTLSLSDEPMVKACAHRHVDEAGRETYWFSGRTVNGRYIQGLVLRKPSWDFTTAKELVTDVSIPLLGKVPMRVVSGNALAYWFGFSIRENALAERTFNGVEAPLEFTQKVAAEFATGSAYWFKTGLRFQFGGNEPEWVASAEPNGVMLRALTRGFDRCLDSLSALISSDVNETRGPTSPFK